MIAEEFAADPAQRGTPIVDAMRDWLAGDVAVPSLGEFLDRFGQTHRDHLRRRREPIPDFPDLSALLIERSKFVSEFAFAVPTREALDRVRAFSPLLEIGAGSGAWARLLAMRGADIIATDPAVEEFSDLANQGWTWGESKYHPVLPFAGKTAVRRWPERNVLCCWPSLGQTWLRQAARAMLPGRVLLVIREDATADDRTWNYLEYHFKPAVDQQGIDNTIELPNWYCLHDRLEVWIKKTRRELAATPARDDDEC
jgi:hypothetical protein